MEGPLDRIPNSPGKASVASRALGWYWTHIWPSEATTVLCTDQTMSPNPPQVRHSGSGPNKNSLDRLDFCRAPGPLRLQSIALLSGSANKQSGCLVGRNHPVGRQTLSDFRRLSRLKRLRIRATISSPILLRPQTTHSRPPPVL
jgi:hypothetical protein